MTFYIIMAIVTMFILLFHFLASFETYKAKLGDTGVWVLVTLAFTLGLIVWPATIIALVLKLLMKVKGIPSNAENS